MSEEVIDWPIGAVPVTLEEKAKFKYLCAKEGISVKDKIANFIKSEVKDVTVE